jgi:hypothetical protein
LFRGCGIEGYYLHPVVALQLGVDLFAFGWTLAVDAFALCGEAVNIALPWNKVSLNVSCCLLVSVDYDYALWAWDFHAEIKPMNGCLKLVDRTAPHYGVVWVDHVDYVECDLLTSRTRCRTK